MTDKEPTLMIATPMYGGMCTGHYVAGLLATMETMRNLGVKVFWTQLTNESLIPRGRNELVRIFLEMDIDFFMFIDADIAFDGNAVASLMAADRDIVCGVYPKKEIDWVQIENAAKNGETNLKDYSAAFVLNMVAQEQTTDADGVIEVRHGGTGFMLIKRHVFEKLKDHVPTYRTSTIKNQEGEYQFPLTHEFFATSIDHTGAMLSEDYYFCELWRKHGGKIFVNPFIRLEHVGTYAYSGNIVRAGVNLK